MAKLRSLSALLLAVACLFGGCDGCAPEPDAGPVCGREVHVALRMPSASPEALEEQVAPIENGLLRLEGVSRVSSHLEPGDALITVSLGLDADRASVIAGVERSVESHDLPEGATLETRGELRITRMLSFVSEARPADLGHPSLEVTVSDAQLQAVGLDFDSLAAQLRTALDGSFPETLDALQSLEIEGTPLSAFAEIRRVDGPRVEAVDGTSRFLRLDEGTEVTLNECDGAPPVQNLVRARIDTQEDNRSHADRRQLAAALMAMAQDAGHTPYLLLDIDLSAALAGRATTRIGATEVLVLSEAPELAEAWRSRELPGASLTVDASDVRRLRVSVEEAQSGAVLARLATSPDVAELLPSPRAHAQTSARVHTRTAARIGLSEQELERLAARSLQGVEVVPGITLKASALDTIRVGADGESADVLLSEAVRLEERFEAPLSRADGRRVRRFEARIVPETDREALLNQVLGR